MESYFQQPYQFCQIICWYQNIIKNYQRMLMNPNRIQQHKADIQKRIQQLEKKLKQPIKTSQISHQTVHQAYVRRSQVDHPYEPRQTVVDYVEPPEVEEIRRRNVLREKTPIQMGVENRRPNYERYGEQSRKQYGNRDKQGGKITTNNSFNAYNYKEAISYDHMENTTSIPPSNANNRDLYDMMTMIIQNQKNLQEEIVLMRSQWAHKDRSQSFNATKINDNYETPLHAINQSGLGVSNANDQTKTYEIRNFQQRDVKTAGKQAQGKSKKKMQIQAPLKQYSFENRSQKMVPNQQQQSLKPILIEQSPQIKQTRAITKQKVPQKKNNSIDLHSLIKNQKSRGQRLIVSEQDKKEFWKKVDGRIRESQKQYRDTFHRNNRHEHEHLIGTSELQKKLKGDLVQKIYSQCNKCMYK